MASRKLIDKRKKNVYLNPSCKKVELSTPLLGAAWLVMVVKGTEEADELGDDSTSRFDDTAISVEVGGPCNPLSGGD